jgi:hypothetical protein
MVTKKLPRGDYIERAPRPEPNIGEEQLTLRLAGLYLERFKEFVRISEESSKSTIMREALSLLFICASTDAQGNQVEVILRRKDQNGSPLPEVTLLEFLDLPTLNSYIKNRDSSN